jgi:hypothetical protein
LSPQQTSPPQQSFAHVSPGSLHREAFRFFRFFLPFFLALAMSATFVLSPTMPDTATNAPSMRRRVAESVQRRRRSSNRCVAMGFSSWNGDLF